MPVSAPVPSSSSSTAAWNVVAVPSPRFAAQTETAEPPSISRPCADHAARAAADQLARARGPRGSPSSTRLRRATSRPPETNTTHEVAARAAELRGRRRRRLERRARGSGTVDRPVPMRTGMQRADDTARGHTGSPCPTSSPSSARPGSARPPSPIALARAAARARRGPGRGLGRRAAGLRRACRSSPAPRDAQEQASSSTGCSASCPIDRDVLRRRLRASAPTPRSTRCSRSGRRPIVVGGTGLYLRAALADLDLRPPVDPAIRERRSRRARPRRAARRAARRASNIAPDRHASASCAPTSCSPPATSRPQRRASCGPRTPAIRRCSPRW